MYAKLTSMIKGSIPFRWDLKHQARLGSLGEGQLAEAYGEFLPHLTQCRSRLLALSGNSDLVFVGGSPESIFGYLSGLLWGTSWFERTMLIQYSNRSVEQALPRGALSGVREYFAVSGYILTHC